MPNYEIVHDQVGPFPRAVLVDKDGQQTIKQDEKGNLIPRVVPGDVLDATSPEILKAPGRNPYEGNLKFWIRVGAVKETDAPVTEEPVPPSVLNNVSVPNSPAGAEAQPVPASRPVLARTPSPVPPK